MGDSREGTPQGEGGIPTRPVAPGPSKVLLLHMMRSLLLLAKPTMLDLALTAYATPLNKESLGPALQIQAAEAERRAAPAMQARVCRARLCAG